MTKDELTAIRALLEKVTQGPWHVEQYGNGGGYPVEYRIRADGKAWPRAWCYHAEREDAEFIALARTLVPQLLDTLAAQATPAQPNDRPKYDRAAAHMTFNGGYHGEPEQLRAFHHGMDTVFNIIEANCLAATPAQQPSKTCASCGVLALHPDDECCRECSSTRWRSPSWGAATPAQDGGDLGPCRCGLATCPGP